MRILLDTTILVDALRARKERRELLTQLLRQGHEIYITALNIAEVYGGMRPHEEPRTEAFLAEFRCFIIDEATARAAGHLKSQWSRKGRTLAIVDCAVAAIAIRNRCVVATDNRKDFPMPELTLYPLP
jgi:predicted nucleic acid-binding protein